jgi:beta-phosphoglucomutase-like phosphatase (HAD superfamily)
MERSGSLQKPHHFPYELGLKLAKLRPEHAIAVEDTSEGITSAQTAGLWCAAIKHSTNRLASLEKADLIIKNYAELEDYLKRHERL